MTNGGGTPNTQIIAWHQEDLRLLNLRESTIYQRGRVLIRLAQHLDGTPLLEATHRDLAAHLARRLAPESRAVEVTHLRRFYEWAVDHDLLDESPARRIRRPRVPRRHPSPISEADLAVAITTARPRIRPWLLLAAFAGLRACEISRMRADHIMWDATPAHIVIPDGKGGHAGTVALPAYLADELAACDLPLTGWLFPMVIDPTKPTPPYLVSRLANQHLHGLGIDRTLHKLRHRYATQVLRASKNLRLTQEALRHVSITSTQLYTQVQLEEIAEVVELLPRPMVGNTQRIAA